MFEDLLNMAWNMGASDLHLAAGQYPMVRIDGNLQILSLSDSLKKSITDNVPLVAEKMVGYSRRLTGKDLDDYLQETLKLQQLRIFENKGEVDFAIALSSMLRCRINVYKSQSSPVFSIRFVRKKIPNCKEIGLPDAVQQFIYAKNGLVLVTGPTGSGKSTTLASLVQKLNMEQRKHIITLEEPIEYVYPQGLSMISQREVGEDTQSYATGLCSALREDPDVILVGELRDSEALRVALQAAETGHLVLSTLHTRDSVSSINRILDMLPSERNQIRTQLADCLVGIVSQELYKKKDSQGRIAVLEVLINNNAVSNLIREGRTHQLYSYLQTGGSMGMQTMKAGYDKLKKTGII